MLTFFTLFPYVNCEHIINSWNASNGHLCMTFVSFSQRHDFFFRFDFVYFRTKFSYSIRMIPMRKAHKQIDWWNFIIIAPNHQKNNKTEKIKITLFCQLLVKAEEWKKKTMSHHRSSIETTQNELEQKWNYIIISNNIRKTLTGWVCWHLSQSQNQNKIILKR